MSLEAAAPRPKPRAPVWPKVSADFVRAVLKGHSALGLAFAAAIYLVCLTGAVAVFAREFQRWETPAAPRLESASPQAVQHALEGAVARAGEGLEHVYITLPTPDLPRLIVTTDAKRPQTWMADGEGRLSDARLGASPWTSFITELHVNLHLPRAWGLFLVGMTGAALLSSLISGLLAHPRIFRDAFHLRLGGSRRLQEADLHNRLGVWALPFHVVVSLTGALLGLTTLIVGVLGLAMFHGDVGKVYDLFTPTPPKDDPRTAPLIDLRPMFGRIPPGDGRIDYVLLEHPTEMGAAALFTVRHPNRLSGSDGYAFDRTGTLYRKDLAAENTLGEKIYGSLGVLHFGWFGGGVVKVAYGLLGLGLAYLAASGVTIWLQRRRDKGRPAPGWERVWSATVWGQPPALAGAALFAVVAGQAGAAGPLAVWAGATLAFLAASARLSAAALSSYGRWTAGGLLVATALAHLTLKPAAGGDPIGWAVDAVVAAIGLLLAWTALRRTRAARRPGASPAAS